MEVLKMDADFYQDENGKIWLFYTKNVVVRKKWKTDEELKLDAKLEQL